MNPIKNYWPGIIWAFIILMLCSIPGRDIPKISLWDIDFWDKVAHFGIFFILSFLLYAGAKGNSLKFVPWFKIRLIMLFGVAYGAFTELYQHLFFESRTADGFDFIADSIGAITGIIFALKIFRKKRN